MDINEAWHNIRFDSSNLPKSIKEITGESKVPLGKIKKSILYNFIVGVVVTLIYPGMIHIMDDTIIRLGTAILLIFSVLLLYDTWKLYRIINPLINPENNISKELKYQYDMVQKWIRIQQKIGLFLYPISVSVGFLFGGISGSGLGLVEFLNKPIVVVSLIITIAVLTPLCYLLVKWLLKYTFAKDLLALEKLMAEIRDVSA